MINSISVVFLAYNEELVIEKNVSRMADILRSFCRDFEIIVVCYEGCKDKTIEIVRKLEIETGFVKTVVQKKSEQGYGRAYALGLSAAKKEWIFQTDADGQYLYDDISKLLKLVSPDISLVHGYRRKRMDPFERIVMAFCYNIALRILYPMRIRDVDSAFKLIRRSSLQGLSLESKSGFCVAESVIKIIESGGHVAQVDITHLPRTEGEALSDKGVKNPFNLQLPGWNLIRSTLGEMIVFRFRRTHEGLKIS